MSTPTALAATSRLREALDALSRALVTPDADGLASAEAGLALALADLGVVTSVAPADRPALVAEVRGARALLARCRVLGAALADAAQASLTAQGFDAMYGRAGAAPPAAVRGVALKARL